MKSLQLICFLIMFGTVCVHANGQVSDTSTYDVGRIEGALDIDTRGQASYIMPLKLVGSGNNLAPRLQLSYHSSASHGVAGYGWNIQGAPRITRCSKNPAVDGYYAVPNLSTADRFCLGGQRLVAVSGKYGEADTEYRTEVDAYTKVVSLGKFGSGPAGFLVYRKDGNIEEYGMAENAQWREKNNTAVMAWALREARDRFNNYISFTYSDDGALLPQTIAYGGNKTAELAHYRSITFAYKDAPYGRDRYWLGTLIHDDQLLDSVTMHSHGRSLWHYQLNHETGESGYRALLKSVDLCAANGRCLAPTTFEYDGEDQPFEVSEVVLDDNDFVSPDWSNVRSVKKFLDFDRDGRDDLFALSKQDGAYLKRNDGGQLQSSAEIDEALQEDWSPEEHPVSVNDIDRDGHPDTVMFLSDHVRIAYGDDSGIDEIRDLDYPYFSMDLKDEFIVNARIVVDVNQDGFLDLLAFNEETTDVRFGTGERASPFADRAVALNDFGEEQLDSNEEQYPRFVLDLNADRYPDIAVFLEDELKVSLGSRDGFAEAQTWSTDFATYSWETRNVARMFADVNLDGYPDIVGYRDTGVYVALGTGQTFAKATLWLEDFLEDPVNEGQYSWDPEDSLRLCYDVNKDGFADFLAIYEEEMRVVFGNGRPLDADKAKVHNYVIENGHWYNHQDPFQLADLNDDGARDLVLLQEDMVLGLQMRSASPRLSRVTNGLGFDQELTWSTLLDTDTYTAGEELTYPLQGIKGSSAPVVRSVRTPDGLGGQRTIEYQYADGRMHHRGLGFLGYGKVTEQDLSAAISVEKHFSFDIAKRTVGSLVHTAQYNLLSDGKKRLLSEASYTYQTRVIENADYQPRFQVFLKEKTDTYYDLDGERLSTTVVTKQEDSLGNAIHVENLTDDSYGSYLSVVDNKFEQENEADWIIGRVTKASAYQAQSGVVGNTRISVFEYEPDTGVLKSETLMPDTAYEKTTTYHRNDNTFGHIERTTTQVMDQGGLDFNEISIRTEYDSLGYPDASYNALEHPLDTAVHVDFGLVTWQKDANNLLSETFYDHWAQIEKSRAPDGVETSQSLFWCTADRACPAHAVYLAEEHTDGGARVRQYVDVLGRVIRETQQSFAGKESVKDVQYNALGLLAKTFYPYFYGEQAAHAVTHEYDEIGRLVVANFPDGSEQRYGYAGYETTLTDRNGNRRIVKKDAVDRKRQVIDFHITENMTDERVLNYYYDSDGNLAELHDPENNVTVMQYDLLGRVTDTFDPGLGHTQRFYNGFDQNYKTVDNMGQESRAYFDALGRTIKAVQDFDGQSERVTHYAFDSAENGIGQLASSKVDDISHTFIYDDLSRLERTTLAIDQQRWSTTVSYDDYSRLHTKHFDGGLSIRYDHDEIGILRNIRDADTNKSYWQLSAANANGDITRAQLGNGLEMDRQYDPLTGRLDYIRTFDPATEDDRHYIDVDFDAAGNTKTRHNRVTGHVESYEYDSLNRLIKQASSIHGDEFYQYDRLGNLTQRRNDQSIKRYDYGKNCMARTDHVGIHDVCMETTFSANGVLKSSNYYRYDGKGQRLAGAGLTYTFGVMNKPIAISGEVDDSVNTQIDFLYGPDDQRVRRTDKVGTHTTETTYISAEHEVVKTASETVHRYHLGGIIIKRTQARQETFYSHVDHLGSVVTLTDASGEVVERRDYDAWGARRESSTHDYPSVATTTMDFTGHEHLGPLNLIHMGGRVYDPNTGRFISADPFIQDPTSVASLNRYSYVWNNPTSRIDPTGYFMSGLGDVFDGALGLVGDIFDGIAGGVDRLDSWLSQNEQQIYATAINIAAMAIASTVPGLGGYLIVAAGGFTSGYIASDGDLDAAAISALQAVAFYYVGGQFQDAVVAGELTRGSAEYIAGKALAHGVIGGAASVARGGNFESGFLAAALSSAAASSGIYGDVSAEVGATHWAAKVAVESVTAGVVGGTVSEVTGGNFESGFVTASYGYLFNHAAHSDIVNEMTTRMLNWALGIGGGSGGQVTYVTAAKMPRAKISSKTDKQGNTIYTREGESGKVVVRSGVSVKDTEGGNTIADVLAVSKHLNKTIYVISGHRTGSISSEHYRVAVDIYIAGATRALTPGYRDQIFGLNLFNRVASYHNKNTIHVDYKSSGNQGRFHDSGKGWVHIKDD